MVDMQGDPGKKVISRRALRVLQDSDNFLKYVLVRADSAGFSVTPARAKSIAQAVAGNPVQSLEAQGLDPIKYYRDIFASFLAQDPESYVQFKKFWDDLWYVEVMQGSQSGRSDSGIERLADMIVDDLLRKMAGSSIRIPSEVIEE